MSRKVYVYVSILGWKSIKWRRANGFLCYPIERCKY